MVDCDTRHHDVVIMSKYVNCSWNGALPGVALEAVATRNLTLQPRAAGGGHVFVSPFLVDCVASPFIQFFHTKVENGGAGQMAHAPAALLIISQPSVLARAARHREHHDKWQDRGNAEFRGDSTHHGPSFLVR